MKATTWIALGLVLILALAAGLALGAGALGHRFPVGMMGGRGSYGYPFGMMGGWGWGIGGLLVMGLMMLVPLGFLVVLVAGIAWLVRAAGTPAASPVAAQSTPSTGECPACRKTTQADWQNCPYCGNSLKP